MSTEKTPLQIILAWWKALPEHPHGSISFGLVTRVTNDELAMMSSDQWVEEWLTEKLCYFRHLGRTIFVRGIIDYEMEERGTKSYWEGATERNLEMVDSAMLPKGARQTINEQLPNLPKSKDAWLAAADSWRKLKSDFLTDERLRAWENEMMIRFAPGNH